MARKPVVEEVGDLFVTKTTVIVKLLPSKKEASRSINWFSDGCVTNVRLAAKDIATLIGTLQGRTRVVRRLTVMSHRGPAELDKTGLPEAVAMAGFNILK